MKDVALGQHFISIVLWLEFSCSVLSRHATSLFTFGGQAGKKKSLNGAIVRQKVKAALWVRMKTMLKHVKRPARDTRRISNNNNNNFSNIVSEIISVARASV